ncbi:MAG TPA: 50S ribosomal protein L11 methyltransferase [Polyangiaceae bacterium]|nr:50S ribosomal protein L11 methyltransferase [Polyangiaceae bacterium]
MALVKLLIDVPTQLAEDVGQALIELGAGGVEEQDGDRGARLIVYGSDRAELSALAERARDALSEMGLDEDSGNVSLRIEVDEQSDWDTAWTRHLEPQALTPHWIIQPFWDETQPPENMDCIFIRPTLAFGDGAHATTRLAAQAVERFCLALPDASVLDIGTGTGVLSLVAALSGARTVVGVDIDAVALAAARENARLNDLEPQIVFQDASAELSTGFDLVVANLEPRALISDAARIADRARDARELVVTGFLSSQAPDVADAFSKYGFVPLGQVEEDEWSLLVLGRRGPSSANPDEA